MRLDRPLGADFRYTWGVSKVHIVQINERVEAPIERVFERFADHEWFAGLFGGSCERVVEGSDEPNGVGSVRRIGPGPLSFDETIVTFERPTRLHYVITRGSPLKNHRGELSFSEQDGATVIDYQIRFEGKLPLLGGATKRALEWAWRQNARRQLDALAREP